MSRPAYCVVVVALGVLVDGVEPIVLPAAVLSVVPEAPIEVPLPVVAPMLEPVPVVAPAVVSVVDGVVVPIEPVLPVVVLVEVSAGDVVVEGVVVLVVELADSSLLPQAVRDRAATTARALSAIGDLIIRNSLWVSFRWDRESDSVLVPAACGSL
jgi:hypothetical protein